MNTILDRVIVHAHCPTCGARIGAPYVQVRTIKLFACGCGTIIDADVASVASQAVLGLANEGELVPAVLS